MFRRFTNGKYWPDFRNEGYPHFRGRFCRLRSEVNPSAGMEPLWDWAAGKEVPELSTEIISLFGMFQCNLLQNLGNVCWQTLAKSVEYFLKGWFWGFSLNIQYFDWKSATRPHQRRTILSLTLFADRSIYKLLGTYVCRITEDFAAQGMTGGCGGGNFCPSSPVTRAQMAVFLVTAPPPLNPWYGRRRR